MKNDTGQWVNKAEDDFRVAERVAADFNTIRQDLEDLTVYGVRVRYPGFDATLPAAREARAAANRVRAYIRGKLGL
jgi:hypothetical protein